jgi:hypothetical protein
LCHANNEAIEFLFRLGERVEGIPYKGERPNFRKPKEIEYPVSFDLEIWSEDVCFSEQDRKSHSIQRTIHLQSTGASTDAIASLVLPEPSTGKDVIALFERSRDRGGLGGRGVAGCGFGGRGLCGRGLDFGWHGPNVGRQRS